jgi:hypothetical protein
MRIQRLWLPSLFLILGMVLPAFGQSGDLKVKVPFPFNVAEARLPVGEYVVSSGSGKVVIRDSRGRTVAMALANQAGKKADKTGRIIFECYGDRCFLSRFWAAGQDQGSELLRSSLETKVAANAMGAYFALLGTTLPH